MSKRLDMHKLLTELSPTSKIYYQPSSNIIMSYPAIIYEVDSVDNKYANNDIYNQHIQFKITVIDKHADSSVVEMLIADARFVFNNSYISDNLYHTIFTIYI